MFIEETISSGVYTSKFKLIPIQFHTVYSIGNQPFFGERVYKTHSPPAVSHHIQILKDACLLKMRKEGTKNYYYFDADSDAMERLLIMLTHAKAIMKNLPDRDSPEQNL